MSSDESDTEERTGRRRERRRDSAFEPADEPVDESASQRPCHLLPVHASDAIPFGAELAAMQAEPELRTRDGGVHDGLSPDDETALPFVRLFVPAVSVVVPLVTLILSYVCGATREAAALVETLTSEPGVIPDPTLVLFVYTCTVQAIVSLVASSIAQGHTSLAGKMVALSTSFPYDDAVVGSPTWTTTWRPSSALSHVHGVLAD